MYIILAALVAIATPAPRPTLPPVIFHVVPKGANTHKACGVYHFEKAVALDNATIVVKCVRPAHLKYLRQIKKRGTSV